MSLGQTDTGGAPPADGRTRPAMLGDVSPEPPSALPTADRPVADRDPDVEQELSSPPKRKPDPKLCGVCGTQPSKYKCPRCSMPYCSVACSKQHKENHPPDPPKPDPPNTNPSQPPDSSSSTSTFSSDPYGILLEHRASFDRLFEKYPSLPAELARIQQATLPPPPPSAESSSLPSSSRPPSIPGLNPHQRRNNNRQQQQQQPWTRDVGLRRGADALRRARTDPGDVGDGVREFCELVLFLLGKAQEQGGREGQTELGVGGSGSGGGGGSGGVVDRVREEVAAEEAKAIERLLREEGG
ncbi:hypothetical protein VTK26DRAFT_6144 [Humicola hyalothermophila]